MRYGRSFPGGRGPPFCMRWRAACWVRRLRRSVLAWSDRSRWGSGFGAKPPLPPSGTGRGGERLGRNARFASLGNGSAAALMGATGYLVSNQAVFIVTFMLAIPTLLALSRIREKEIDVAQSHGAVVREVPDKEATSVFHLLRQRPLLIFAGG